ncbi:MAG: AbrB/MazE/SpoVT family DNA-binding domain-containing protein [Nakamurella sp.]
MNGTYQVVMGDRGRLVIPAPLRERNGFAEGTRLTMIETPAGLVLLSRRQLQHVVRQDLADVDLVSDLLRDRRSAAAAEDRPDVG